MEKFGKRTKKKCSIGARGSVRVTAVFLALLGCVTVSVLNRQSRYLISLPNYEITTETFKCQASAAKLTPRDQIVHVVQDVAANQECKDKDSKGEEYWCIFDATLQAIWDLSIQQDTTLLTMQVGGMDGKAGDPMYRMIKDKSLKNWLPVVFEPVHYNFHQLTLTYEELAEKNGLQCSVLAQRVISDDPLRSMCAFCYYNDGEDAPDLCKLPPDWVRQQLGTLQCDKMKAYLEKRRSGLEECIIEEYIPCSSLQSSLQELLGLSFESVAMLQMDVEGYEYHLVQNLVSSASPQLLPPVIHFETKVLIVRDNEDNTTSHEKLTSLLEGVGYKLFDNGMDCLGLLL